MMWLPAYLPLFHSMFTNFSFVIFSILFLLSLGLILFISRFLVNGITIKNHHFSSFTSNALVVVSMLFGISITTNMFNRNIEVRTPIVNYNYIANFDSNDDESGAERSKPKAPIKTPTYGYLQNGMYLLSNNVLVEIDDIKKYGFLLSLSELFQMKNYAAATKQIVSKGLLDTNHPDRIINIISAFYISSMFAEGRYVETLRHICNMINVNGGVTQKQIIDIQFVIFRAFWSIRGQTNNEDALILEIARINKNCKGSYLSPYFGLVSSRHYNNINNGEPHEGFIDKDGRHKPLLNLFNRIDDNKDKYIDYARYSLGKFDEIIRVSKNKNIIALAHLSLASALLYSKPHKAFVHAERYIELTNTKQFNLPKKIRLADNIKVSVDKNLDYLYRRYKGNVIADNFSGIIMEIIIDHINSGSISSAIPIFLKAKNHLAFNRSTHKEFFQFMNKLSDFSTIKDKDTAQFNTAILVRDHGWLLGIHVDQVFLNMMKRLTASEQYGDKSTYLIARHLSHDNAKDALKYFHEFENKFPKSNLYDDVLTEIGVLYAFRLGKKKQGRAT